MEEYKKLLLQSIIPSNETDEYKIPIYKKLAEEMQKLIPDKLYRYRSFSERSLSALLEDKIYFSRPIDFNDPYDCLYQVSETLVEDILKQNLGTDFLKSNIDKVKSGIITKESINEPNFQKAAELGIASIIKASESDIEQLLNTFKNESFVIDTLRPQIESLYRENHALHLKNNREETGIACFSEDVKSMLMWSHYADYHKGFCLEYDARELQCLQFKCHYCNNKCNVQRVLQLHPILYGDDRYDATNYEYEMLKHSMQFEILKEDLPLYIPDMLHYVKANTFKSNDWSYEKEWRLIFSCKPNCVPIKYEVLRPKAIYIGSKMSKSNKDIIFKLIDGKGIKVFEMTVDETSPNYRLEFNEIFI